MLRLAIAVLTLFSISLSVVAQDEGASSSSSSVVRRRAGDKARDAAAGPQVTDRMQSFFSAESSLTDADMQWMRVIYRQIDLEKDRNAALYFPE